MTAAGRCGAPARARLGIDLGGTKIEGVILDGQGAERARLRIPAPSGVYGQTIEALACMVANLEADAGVPAHIGIGVPGSISPATGKLQNANSVWLNGRRLKEDLESRLGRPVRLANDANCFAVSEATDGAGAGAKTVFGVILGTGCGGGIAIDGRIVDGPRGIGGEWGHNPLPWMTADEALQAPPCWCGRRGCMETWVSGTGLGADHARVNGEALSAEAIATLAADGDGPAKATLERHADRLARGLAHVINLIDPDVVVLGGGLSNLDHLYDRLPLLMARWIFADAPDIAIRRPRWGDASGVRGAAWLWS